MPRIILLAAIAAVIYILYRRAQSAPPHLRRNEYIKLVLAVSVIVVIGLTLTGRMHWLGAAFTGLLVAARQMGPTLIRLFPMLSSLGAQRANQASAGQSSTVATDILSMQLDHETGNLSGTVLKGAYEGWLLLEMNRTQLEELLAFCQREDTDSVQLLESYLQQRFPGEQPFGQQQSTAADSNTGMNRKEALEVLGIDEAASEEDIVAAHRKLMQKIHPDRGGNDYLASKINQAKDFLLS